MIYFTGDTHFCHFNSIKHSNRPYTTVEEMDGALIDNWNSIVTNNDTVYHLGDFAWKNPEFYKNQLNGDIKLIRGNHDKRYSLTCLNKLFSEVHDYKCIVLEDIPIILSHYAFRVWDRSHYNSWHLYGHSHGRLASQGKSFDVGVDCTNYIPISWNKVKEIMSNLPDNLNLVK